MGIKSIKMFSGMASIAGLMALALVVQPVTAAANTIVVTPDDTKGWTVSDTDALSSVNYVDSDDTSFGDGALQLLTTADPTGDKASYRMPVNRVDLDSVTSLQYDAIRNSGSAQDFQTISYQMELDFNGDATGGFTTIVFEPIYTYGNDAVAATAGTWQTWDAFKDGEAKWWSTRDINGVTAFDTQNVTFNDIRTSNPDAVITSLVVNYGSGSGAFDGYVDGLMFNDTTYDFERVAPRPVAATSKDDCKDGGWMNFQTQYKNQGQCVSSVASSKRQ